MLRVKNLYRYLVLWSGVPLLALSLPAAAYNGALAIAVPVAGIEIDGDFSDWPAGMRQYPVALVEVGDAPKDPRDYQGSFRIGYNEAENALYLAIEAQDESIVLQPSSDLWNTQDGCEVYVEAGHEGKEAVVGQYTVRGNTPGAFGNWAARPDFEEATRRGLQTHRYEWRIDIGEKTQNRVQLRPGGVLGVDVALCDKDADGSFSWIAWGPGGRKYDSSARVGAVVLAKAGEIGRLRGRLVGRSGQGINRAKVRVRSLQPQSPWLTTSTDRQGIYDLELPTGTYQLEPELRVSGEQGRTAQVGKGTLSEVEAWVAESGGVVSGTGRGKVFKAGPFVKGPQGRRARAGGGIWKGAWQTLENADGLAGALVLGLCQDRDGGVWMGTIAGVCRYDGQEFITYTTEDGLGDNTVPGVLQDRQGNMWFGTDGHGVSRYDGKEMVTYTTADGLGGNRVWGLQEDRQGRMWFTTLGGGVSQYDGKEFRSFTIQDGLADSVVQAVLEDRDGNLWFGTQAGLSRYDGQEFKTFTMADGLAQNNVLAIAQDRDGNLWFGTGGGGVSRYDGREFKTFTMADGLAQNTVLAIAQDRDGNLWFGTGGGGVSRYDGKKFKSYTAADGLAFGEVRAILADRSGDMWFGTGGWGSWGKGVSRYTGEEILTYTAKDGLVADQVTSIAEDQQGNLWFGTPAGVSRYDGQEFKTFLEGANVRSEVMDRQGNLWFVSPDGTYRYDGKTFRRFSTADGLVGSAGGPVLEDSKGNLWFGTDKGVSRYDGQGFRNFTTGEGLLADDIWSIAEDRQGNLWFGAIGGVSRYDGQGFKNFTTENGLDAGPVSAMREDSKGILWVGGRAWVSRYDGKKFTPLTTADGTGFNGVADILEDRPGHLWFGTTGGLSQYDGLVCQTLLTRDGLPHNGVNHLLQDRKGNLWIATDGGVMRYRPHPTPPGIRLRKVVVDYDRGPVEEVDLSRDEYLAFEFQGSSFKTRPGQLAYVYRLRGGANYNADWKVTREEQVVYTKLPMGEYVFEVKAVDRDLTYSATPATVKVSVHLPYTQLVLGGGLALALIGLALVSGTAIRRHHAFLHEQQARLQVQEQLNQELEDELQTAHTLQMDLMPSESPHIAGLTLAGRCIPANHVGGDFYQYFLRENKLSITMADVTGHAMEAAIPMVMFSGILENQMEQEGTPQDLFARLNRSLHRTLKNRSLVCCVLAELDLDTRVLRLASAAFPYPYHFGAATGEITELQVDAYPLGVRPDTRYAVVERQLAPGDYLVFCSDGIIEATDETGAQYGYERTAEVIRRGCAENLSAEALLARVIEQAKAFSGEVPQGDDQTVVVLRVEK